MSSFSETEKALLEKFCREEIELLEAKCRGSIDYVGGEEHLLERIDLLVWVYSDRSDMKKYREVLRFLDGEENVDWEKISWVLNSFRERERLCRGIAEHTRRVIEENIYNEDRLREETERAKKWKTALDALTREAQRGQTKWDSNAP